MSDQWWIVFWIGVALVAVVTMAFAIQLGVRLVATKKMLGRLGAGSKVAFYGALVYTIFPADLLPDPIYLDDIGVLAAVLAFLTNLVRKRRLQRTVEAQRMRR